MIRLIKVLFTFILLIPSHVIFAKKILLHDNWYYSYSNDDNWKNYDITKSPKEQNIHVAFNESIYYKNILLSDQLNKIKSEHIGIYFGNIEGYVEIFVNNIKYHTSIINSEIIQFELLKKDLKDSNEIVIKIQKNLDMILCAVTRVPYIENYNNIRNSFYILNIIQIVIGFCLFFLGLFIRFYYSLQLKNHEFLIYFFLCLCSSFYAFLRSHLKIYLVNSLNVNWLLLIKLEYFLLYIQPFLSFLLLIILFKRKGKFIKILFKAILIVNSVLVFIALIANYNTMIKSLSIFHSYSAILFIVYIYLIVYELFHRKFDTIIILIGFFFLIFFSLIDVLGVWSFVNVIDKFPFFILGYFITLLFSGFYLSRQYRKVNLALKKLSGSLEEQVKERTLKLEKANKNIEEKNIQLKKLNSFKNDFIANITHDFRSPLTIIMSTADLGIKVPQNESTVENFQLIYDASFRLKNSIDKLLDLAKIDAIGIKLNIQKVKIVQFFNQLFNFYSSSFFGNKVEMIKNFPDKEIYIYVDIEKLEQVMSNLLSNAVKFVDKNNGKIIMQIKEQEKSVLISIYNNGTGIAKDKLQSIFNRFEQAKNGKDSPHKGTGIGLAFAKQLIVSLKGKIWAESDGENRGAKFYLELQKGKAHFASVTEDIAAVYKTSENEMTKILRMEVQDKFQDSNISAYINNLNNDDEFNYKKGIILIIDDDVNIAKIIMKYLKNTGYQNFVLAFDGKQGLDAVYKYSPHLIISDYNMPNMNGDEFQNALLNNSQFNKIPFIFLSAIADKQIILNRRKKGAIAYLKKPIDSHELTITVDQNIKIYFEYLKTLQFATIDDLTGINNRRSILSILKKEISVRRYRDLAVIIIDLDYFKNVNDNYGHQAGDIVLSTISRIFKTNLRTCDEIGRYGGEEFLVILPDTNLEQAANVAEELKIIIENEDIKFENEKLSITASFGISSLTDASSYIAKKLNLSDLKKIFNVENPETVNWGQIKEKKLLIGNLLIQMADEALYNAKKTVCSQCGFNSEKKEQFKNSHCSNCNSNDIIIGRNKVSVFEPIDHNQ